MAVNVPGRGVSGGDKLCYYQPAPTCYQDEVWRRLPDGRIQTGVRTRCY